MTSSTSRTTDASHVGMNRSGKLTLLNERKRYSQGASFTVVLGLDGWPHVPRGRSALRSNEERDSGRRSLSMPWRTVYSGPEDARSPAPARPSRPAHLPGARVTHLRDGGEPGCEPCCRWRTAMASRN